jgi:DNA-directed RNA polymerase alpha subunit
MPIEDLDLPQRAFNSLKRHGITKVGQLLQTPDEELLRMRNFGKKSLDEIKERLAARGLIEAPEPSEATADEPVDDSQSDDLDDETTDDATADGETVAAKDEDR